MGSKETSPLDDLSGHPAGSLREELESSRRSGTAFINSGGHRDEGCLKVSGIAAEVAAEMILRKCDV